MDVFSAAASNWMSYLQPMGAMTGKRKSYSRASFPPKAQ
jgi:hypothetical protein